MSQREPTARYTGLRRADGIVLEEHQVQLLRALVEAHRSVEPREPFIFHDAMRAVPDAPLIHPGLAAGVTATPADLQVLVRAGFIMFTHEAIFSVTPQAVRYYSDVLQREGAPTERVEQAVRRYIDTDGFKSRHPAAYAKWAKAEELLWAADAPSQLTAIGHHCREAVQNFATALVAQYKPPDCPADPASTGARVRALLNVRRASLPSTVQPFLDALLNYWGTVLDLHQRQEHGAQREREPLTWEDGRRVVFQTLLVMYELDRTLSITGRPA